MRLRSFRYLISLSFAAFVAVSAAAQSQEIAIHVNGELITSHDIVQRAMFQNLPNFQNRIIDFYERVNVLLGSDKFREKFRQKMSAVETRTPEEAQRVSERFKNELIEEAVLQILFEHGAARKFVIDALIDDKLKLQAAKRLGIEISDEAILKSIMVDRMADGEKPDVNAYYTPRIGYGIARKTLREVIRAQLAWRAVMNRTYGPAPLWQKSSVYESFSRGYLEKLRRIAIIN